jgi:hypothetical protein
MKKAKCIILLMLAFILLTGCIKSQGSTTLLKDNTCTAPCWNGLIPGETSENDAVKILNELPQVKPGSVRIWYPDGVHKGDSFYLISGEQVDLMFQDDKLLYIGFSYPVKHVFLNVTYQQLIDEFGDPGSIIRIDSYAGENLYTLFISLYTDQGIAYSLFTNRGWIIFGFLTNITKISPGTHVDRLYYFDPENIDGLIDKGNISGGIFTSQDIDELTQPWKGYGNIEKLYPQVE